MASGGWFFVTAGWPDEEGSAYHPGWVILDGSDPTQIKQRSAEPLMSPMFAWDQGTSPYTCNVPNVVFLEAARVLETDAVAGRDLIQVFYGGADAVIGSAVVEVSY